MVELSQAAQKVGQQMHQQESQQPKPAKEGAKANVVEGTADEKKKDSK